MAETPERTREPTPSAPTPISPRPRPRVEPNGNGSHAFGDAGPAEWAALEPTEKEMGLVRLTLDKGVKTTAIGQLYGLDFEIEGDGFNVRLFFDYYNRRLKVLDYEASNYRALSERLTWLAKANEFDKIFLKATARDWQTFLGQGFMLEGILRYYFRGDDAYVLSKFGSVERVNSPHLIEESEIIEELMTRARDYEAPPLPPGYRMVLCTDEHIPALVALYRQVFNTYPSPLAHPDYIQQTMRRFVVYRAILDEAGELVSAASAEINQKHSNAELTDCATLEDQRGKALMFHLLRALEDDLRDRNIENAFTLAFARSVGMNLVFYRLGYEYSGRLLNNCDILGSYEDMNIWVKPLQAKA